MIIVCTAFALSSLSCRAADDSSFYNHTPQLAICFAALAENRAPYNQPLPKQQSRPNSVPPALGMAAQIRALHAEEFRFDFRTKNAYARSIFMIPPPQTTALLNSESTCPDRARLVARAKKRNEMSKTKTKKKTHEKTTPINLRMYYNNAFVRRPDNRIPRAIQRMKCYVKNLQAVLRIALCSI